MLELQHGARTDSQCKEPSVKRIIGRIALLLTTFAGATAWNTAIASEDDQLTLAVIGSEEMSTLAKH